MPKVSQTRQINARYTCLAILDYARETGVCLAVRIRLHYKIQDREPRIATKIRCLWLVIRDIVGTNYC